MSLYGNLVEDEGAIAIAESKVLLKLKHLFITSNRIRREGIEALKNAKCRTRLCHLHVDDLEEFFYECYEDNSKEINLRLSYAIKEMKHYNEYKYVLINDNVQKTVKDIKKIIEYNNLIFKNKSQLNKNLKRIINT